MIKFLQKIFSSYREHLFITECDIDTHENLYDKDFGCIELIKGCSIYSVNGNLRIVGGRELDKSKTHAECEVLLEKIKV